MGGVLTTREILVSYYRYIKEGTFDALFDLFDESIVLYVPGRSLIAGTYRGFSGMREFYKRMNDQKGEYFTIDVDPLTIEGERAVSVENIEVNRRDQSVVIWMFKIAVHFHVQKGLIKELRITPFDQYYYDDYYAPYQDPYVDKTYRLTYDSGWIFDIAFSKRNTMKCAVVADPSGGGVRESRTRGLFSLRVGAGLYWLSWQETTELQPTTSMLMDFNSLRIDGYMTYRSGSDERNELFHSGSFAEIDQSRFGLLDKK
ncbi:TPA: nuclear transport factor 2 family protein [Pseudomonas aeruginosa]|nr:nuclear transport factor 2 family protein [Pseudomonas aeruginosa]